MLDLYLVGRDVHPTVTLDLKEGETLSTEVWKQQGEILRRGLHGCRVVVKGFETSPSGVVTINLNVRPLSAS